MREDQSFGLFVGDTIKGRVRRKDVSHFGENVSFVYLCSSTEFFATDHTLLLPDHREQSALQRRSSRTTQTFSGYESREMWSPPNLQEVEPIATVAGRATRQGRSARHPMLALEVEKVRSVPKLPLQRPRHTRISWMLGTARNGWLYCGRTDFSR